MKENFPEDRKEDGTGRNQWHPAFCSAVGLELWENKDDLKYEREHNLSKKPLQIDLLVIKKSDDAVIRSEIGKIFRRDNIMEFKSPRDGLNINDYFKVLAYACLYKAEGGTAEELKSDDITISLVRDTKPVKLMKAFEGEGMTVSKHASGIYYVKSMWFPLQIIATSELDKREHRWMRALTENLSYDEAKELLRGASAVKGTDEEELVDSVMTVSMAANKMAFRELFYNIKGESEMYQFAKILFEDEIKEAEIKARKEERKAVNVKTAKRMLEDGDLPHGKIAAYSDLPLEEVEKLAEELNSGLQLV